MGKRRLLAAAVATMATVAPMGGMVEAASPWQPVEEPYITEPFEACGTTITATNDIFDLEYREKVQKNRYVYEERGTWTVDFTTEDGREVQDVANSGKYKEVAKDGTVILTFSGPAMLLGTTPEDEAAQAALGLPNPFYFTTGKFVVQINPDGSAQILRRPNKVTSICDMLS